MNQSLTMLVMIIAVPLCSTKICHRFENPFDCSDYNEVPTKFGEYQGCKGLDGVYKLRMESNGSFDIHTDWEGKLKVQYVYGWIGGRYDLDFKTKHCNVSGRIAHCNAIVESEGTIEAACDDEADEKDKNTANVFKTALENIRRFYFVSMDGQIQLQISTDPGNNDYALALFWDKISRLVWPFKAFYTEK